MEKLLNNKLNENKPTLPLLFPEKQKISSQHMLQTLDTENSQKPVESYRSIPLSELHYRKLKLSLPNCFPTQATAAAATSKSDMRYRAIYLQISYLCHKI